MLYELAVVGDLPLPSYSHASVLRSSKQGMYKTSSKASPSAPGPSVPPVKNLLNGNGRLPLNANLKYRQHVISLERSALHQALYPKHAHLFETRPMRSSPEWDLSPSMFTRDSDSPDSINPPPDAQAVVGPADPNVQSIPSMLNRSEQDASETLSMTLGQESWQAGPSGPSRAGLSAVPDMYWESPFAGTELAAFQQLHASNIGHEASLPQPVANSYPLLAADSAVMFARPDDNEMVVNEQPSSSFSNFMPQNAVASTSSNHATEQQFDQEPTAFPTSSDFLAAGIYPDSDEGQATLAMWSNVPANFE